MLPQNFSSMKRALYPTAFTLVEVVIALGIVSFALVGIFGLLAYAVEGTKGADLSTKLTIVIASVASKYQCTSFEDGKTELESSPYDFDFDAIPLQGRAGEGEPYFECFVRPVNSSSDGLSDFRSMYELEIRWPKGNPTSSNTTLYSVFNYGPRPEAP
jgi:uncharacterized protein (TIGR02598 family)